MSIDIAHNRGDIASVEVVWFGQKSTVEYRPGEMTGGWLAEEAGASNGSAPNPIASFRLWSEVIESWDIIDNGEPVPISSEGMQIIPFPRLMLIQQKIIENAMTRGTRVMSRGTFGSVLDQIFGETEKGD